MDTPHSLITPRTYCDQVKSTSKATLTTIHDVAAAHVAEQHASPSCYIGTTTLPLPDELASHAANIGPKLRQLQAVHTREGITYVGNMRTAALSPYCPIPPPRLRELYSMEHVRRLLAWEARTTWTGSKCSTYCNQHHVQPCAACTTCHFCRYLSKSCGYVSPLPVNVIFTPASLYPVLHIRCPLQAKNHRPKDDVRPMWTRPLVQRLPVRTSWPKHGCVDSLTVQFDHWPCHPPPSPPHS